MNPCRSESIPIPGGRKRHTRIINGTEAIYDYTPSPERSILRTRSNSSGREGTTPDSFPPDGVYRTESENNESAPDSKIARFEYMILGLSARVNRLEVEVITLRNERAERR